MSQTFQDFEVIVVDDESPDNSMAIVAEFARKYPEKITMIHQKNTRQGGARNRGVREAKGEYLLFVDSDDYVAPNWLERVDAHLRKEDCDILAYQYTMVTQEGKLLRKEGIGGLKPGRYIPRENREVILIPVGPVLKAYRRSFYLNSGFRFPEKLLYEDACLRILFAKAESIVLCDESLYFYVQSSNSSMRQKPSEKMLDILKIADLILESFREAGLYAAFEEPVEAAVIQNILHILDLINASEPKSPLQLPLVAYLRRHFPEFRENAYLREETKLAVACLMDGDFRRYHNRFLRYTLLREWLMQWPVVQWLNALRKGL